MKTPGNALVIDASVAVKLFVPEEHSDKASRIFALADAPEPTLLFVPDLFFIECANVFRRRAKKRAMTADDAMKALDILVEFPFERLNGIDLSASALDLALQHDLSVYDACYLALASLVHSPLVTADRKFARKLSASTHQVIWLGEWAG